MKVETLAIPTVCYFFRNGSISKELRVVKVVYVVKCRDILILDMRYTDRFGRASPLLSTKTNAHLIY